MDKTPQRRWKRLSAELRLRLLVINSGREQHVLGTHMNPSGIFVQMADPPPVGTEVQVTLASDTIDGALTAQGIVANRAVLDDGNHRPPGIGINLQDTGPAWTKLYECLSFVD